MELTNDMVRQLAQLSRLHVDEAEASRLKEDLGRMIQFVEKLQELDTTGVEPLLHMTDNVDVLRPDVVANQLDRATALAIAPDANEEFVFVPKVIKK
ncbi:MAG TPA: Asp-tRNA(Asn)/Glu-tRNA(Gln) amidotransferase subunit GatC [Flavihumibacter sp.]|jgi:aspartyl-tRNA(Asn)/glutamyl-tRNA(Gln) amidotransferase subunit C